MEVGEIVANAVAHDSAEKCWFCEEEPKTENPANDETADPETSNAEVDEPAAVPENRVDNNSSKLGKALGSEPSWRIANPLKPGSTTAIVPAAHHCIPGEASLAQAAALHDFMRKDGPYNFSSDIGYNVNSAENGVWLPGNYAVREGNKEFDSKTWTAQPPWFLMKYVKLAMDTASGKMFHDAHRKYNSLAKQALLNIAGKLHKPDTKTNCPICKKKLSKENSKNRAPFGLVGRLNRVSGDHRRMLLTPTVKTVSTGYFTSSKGRDVVLGIPVPPQPGV
jgi:endogenous inhibitor of DNA gyrase (YacG/DUF329 family)